MSDGVATGGLALQAFLSPGYPVGSYAYSHGLEWMVEANRVRDYASLSDWISGLITYGSGWNDAVLIALTHRLWDNGDSGFSQDSLSELAELAFAVTATEELRQETLQQGAAFLQVTRVAWPHALLEDCAKVIGSSTSYPVCYGIAVRAHACDLSAAVDGYIFALVSNWVSAAVRLNVIGQTAAQSLSAELVPTVCDIGARARQATIDDLGSCAFLADIASFQHARQQSRLFRS